MKGRCFCLRACGCELGHGQKELVSPARSMNWLDTAQLQSYIQSNATCLFIPGPDGSETALHNWARRLQTVVPCIQSAQDMT